MSSAEEIANQIILKHVTYWQYMMDDAKCVGSPKSVFNLQQAITNAVAYNEAREAERLAARHLRQGLDEHWAEAQGINLVDDYDAARAKVDELKKGTK